jgi:hypothetical protein
MRNFVEREHSIFGDIANFVPRLIPIREMSFQYENQYAADEDTPEGHWSAVGTGE